MLSENTGINKNTTGIRVTGGETFVAQEVFTPLLPAQPVDVSNDEEYYAKFPPVKSLPTMGFFAAKNGELRAFSPANLQMVVSESKSEETSKSFCVIS